MLMLFEEGRGLPQPGSGVRAGNSLPRVEILQQDQDRDADLEVKLYIYQLFRALAYIHSRGICHRDIKPQNLLLDPTTGVLKLCDFGSAKILVPRTSLTCRTSALGITAPRS